VTGRPRRAVRVVLLLTAMVVAFALGAFVASRAELFPPQVQDGGVVGTGSPTADPGNGGDRWRGTISSVTTQGYNLGDCETDWRSSVRLVVEPNGIVRGDGAARLSGKPRCPFVISQPQIEGYAFEVSGRVDGGRLRLELSNFQPTAGILDYGGFQATVASVEPTLEITMTDPDAARGRIELQRTQDLHLSRSRNVIRLSCRTCGT
jgi:hypothetical protein